MTHLRFEFTNTGIVTDIEGSQYTIIEGLASVMESESDIASVLMTSILAYANYHKINLAELQDDLGNILKPIN